MKHIDEVYDEVNDEQHVESTPYLACAGEDWSGEGMVIYNDFYTELNSLAKADLLQDWMDALQDEYDKVTGDGFLSDIGGTGINEPPASGAIN